MSTATVHSADSPASPMPEAVAWHCWPLIDGAPWSLLSCLIPWGVAWAIQAAVGSWAMGILIAAALLGSVWRYWIPTHWRCDEQGLWLHVTGWHQRFSWSSFHSYRVRGDGVLLFVHADNVPIDALRALFVPWGTRGADVLRHVEFRLGSQANRATDEASVTKTKIAAVPSGAKKKPSSTVTGSLNLFFDFFR